MAKAIILAAGYGTRLGSLTKNCPKPAIKIGGKSIISRIIDNLQAAGITETIINLHYLPETIAEEVASRALFFYEPILLGHEGTISALRGWIGEDDFFVINGDTISNVNFDKMQRINDAQGSDKAIIALMEEYRCCGTWLYPKEYFTEFDLRIIPYRQHNLVWHDTGTPERLEVARQYYESAKYGNTK